MGVHPYGTGGHVSLNVRIWDVVFNAPGFCLLLLLTESLIDGKEPLLHRRRKVSSVGGPLAYLPSPSLSFLPSPPFPFPPPLSLPLEVGPFIAARGSGPSGERFSSPSGSAKRYLVNFRLKNSLASSSNDLRKLSRK